MNRTKLVVGLAAVFGVLAGGALAFVDPGPAARSVMTTLAGTSAGAVPDDEPLSPFDTDAPALANLDPALLTAVQAAARDAEADGVAIRVTSGWRSRSYQRLLLAGAIVEYGSPSEARRFVSPPDESHHVTGEAVDIGPADADSWLSQHGARYGLCQMMANERWHFELATEPGGECPAMRSDASDR